MGKPLKDGIHITGQDKLEANGKLRTGHLHLKAIKNILFITSMAESLIMVMKTRNAMVVWNIVTNDSFENFELNLEWKISKNGNSGIFYTVQEIDAYDEGWKSSPEMQIMDEEGQKDGLITSHRAGDLYDLIASNERRAWPQGEWNKVRIIKKNGAVEHWLNGAKILSYDTKSPNWKGHDLQ